MNLELIMRMSTEYSERVRKFLCVELALWWHKNHNLTLDLHVLKEKN